MTTKLITGTCLQLLRRYDNRSESYRAQLLDDVIIIIIFICYLFGDPRIIFYIYLVKFCFVHTLQCIDVWD